ncbi:MAG: V-type ATP synthase subunit I [Promethearchaeota archaeon]
MFTPEQFGKFTIAINEKQLGVLLNLLATKYAAEIKEIKELPKDFILMESELALIDEEDQEFSLRGYKARMMEKKLQEIGEQLVYIFKELKVSISKRPKTRYEFHAHDLDDLIQKMLEETRRIYLEVQKNINNRIANKRAIVESFRELAIVESLSFFDYKKEYNKKYSFINVLMVIITDKNYEAFKKSLDKENLVYHDTKVTDKDFFFTIVFPTSQQDAVSDAIRLYNAVEFHLKDEHFKEDGTLNIEKINKKSQKLLEEKKELENQLKQIKESVSVEALALYELFRNAQRFINYHSKMHVFKDIVIAEFWITIKEWPSLENDLKQMFKEKATYKFTPITRYEITSGEEAEVKHVEEIPPTKISVPKIIEPFTVIINLYGVPKYNEINPILFVAFSFPLFFGLMFGDFGQGLILLFVGLFLAKSSMFKDHPARKKFSYVVAYCGLGATIGGIIYGESFGFEFSFWIFPLIRPLDESLELFGLTIWIGIMQMTLGLLLRASNYVITKRKFLIIADVIPKIGMLWSMALIIQEYGVSVIPDGQFWFSYPGFIPIFFLGLLFGGELLGKLFRVKYLKDKSSFGLIGEKSMDVFETILQFLSNTFSYVRILAMTMVHLGFMLAIRLIIKMFFSQNIAGEVIIYILGNTAVMMLELLFVIIQNIRLHFYEFFSKFYSGGGNEFRPIKYDENLTKLYFDSMDVFIKEATIIKR